MMSSSSRELFAQGKRDYQQGHLDAAATCFEEALQQNPGPAHLESNLLLTLNYLPGFDQEKLFALHQAYDQHHGRPLAGLIKPHVNSREPHRRLKIGYVSPDLRGHSVAFFFAPVLAHHNRSRIEVFAYYNHQQQDGFTQNLRQLCHHWRDAAGLSDQQLADQIRKDEIDILVDLAGHSAFNRLPVFAQKPAPVQVTWLGYPNTTGLSTIDYRITDQRVDPQGTNEQYYTEQLMRLPNSFLCYSSLRQCPDITPLPATRNGYITFASLNSFSKINEGVIDLWIQLLKRVPDSRLVLIYNGGKKPWLDDMIDKARSSAEIPFAALRAMANLEYARHAFADGGLLPGRVSILGRSPTDAMHLQHYLNFDIALDPFPYNGTTTTFESLWMGVPVVALRGSCHASRVSADILGNLGFEDLAGGSPDDYIKAATELASDRGRLASMRAGLRSIMSASLLMNGTSFTANLEAAYRSMWASWCGKG